MSRTLLLSTLIAKRACSEQVERFRSTFGESVEITPELCLSVADKFDWDWAAWRLLSAPAHAEYDRVRAPAWAEYDRVVAQVWALAYIGDAS